VTLDVLVGKDGVIQTLSVREGHPLLAESALQTVRHWTYRPTEVNGVAVEVQTEIELSFTLP
jgi:protein TonB